MATRKFTVMLVLARVTSLCLSSFLQPWEAFPDSSGVGIQFFLRTCVLQYSALQGRDFGGKNRRHPTLPAYASPYPMIHNPLNFLNFLSGGKDGLVSHQTILLVSLIPLYREEHEGL